MILDRIHEKYNWLGVEKFLGNGFRAYDDCHMPEIATPECSPDNVGFVQLSSEKMVMDALEDICAKYRYDGWRLPLRVDDGINHSSGFHENYQLFDKYPNSYRFDNYLSNFTDTIYVWSGQGMVVPKDGLFQLQQKTRSQTSGNHNHLAVKSGAVGDRLVEFRRHNYPITNWQLRYRAPYISGLIRCLEQGLISPILLDQYREDAGIFANQAHIDNFLVDQSPSQKMTSDEDYIGALHYQTLLAEKVLSIAEARSFPDYETDAARQVLEVCNYLKQEDLRRVGVIVPWVVKLLFIEKNFPELITDINPTEEAVYAAQNVCIALDSFGGATKGASRRVLDKHYAYTEDPDPSNVPCLEVAKKRGAKISKCVVGDDAKYQANWMTSELTKRKAEGPLLPTLPDQGA